MKYLFILLPIFCFAQGGDSTLYGVRFDSIITHGSFLATPNSSGFLANRHEFYVSDRKPKVVESFKYLGAYYELRENGWYKENLQDTTPWHRPGEEFPDTCWRVMGNIRILKPGCSVNSHSGVESWQTEWAPCDQQFGEVDHPKRDKIEQSEVKILVWTGCALAEYKATKFLGYNYYDDQFYISGGAMQRTSKDYIVWYLAGDKWIKPSHVIKEL